MRIRVTFISLLLIVSLQATLLANACSALPIPSLPSTDVPRNTYAVDPRAYGAKGDGITDDAAAIQEAIDVCTKRGSGIVVLKTGTFLSSPIVLKSGVYLKIDALAVLKAVPYEDYPKKKVFGPSKDPWDFPGTNSPQPFISAAGAANVGIFGSGTIDGNGQIWWEKFIDTKGTKNPLQRPLLVYLLNCHNILIKDVTLQNSAEWDLTLKNSHNVVVSGAKILNPGNSPNTDGINPSGSTNVFINNCIVDTGDDNIAIKAHNNPTKNVYITNCTFYQGHGLSIGSETYYGVQNVYVDNCKFFNTSSGIRVKSGRDRGNLIKDLHYSNITMQDVKTAILITKYYPKIPNSGSDSAQEITKSTPRFEKFSISGLTATATSEAGVIVGLPESGIKGMTLTNVKISAPKGIVTRNASLIVSDTTIRTAQGPAYIIEEGGSVIEYKR